MRAERVSKRGVELAVAGIGGVGCRGNEISPAGAEKFAVLDDRGAEPAAHPVAHNGVADAPTDGVRDAGRFA